MNKKKLKDISIFVGKKAFGASVGAIVFIAVAGTSLWALAAFTEPTAGPSASIQDFATNIMGANNADNAFDSSSVTANDDGSALERLEAIEGRMQGVTALSAKSTSGNSHSYAATYCRNLSATAEYAINGSDTSTTYDDWRLPTIEELAIFEGITSDHVSSLVSDTTGRDRWQLDGTELF